MIRLPIFSQRKIPDEQLISLADSFSYVSPAVIEHKLIALSEQPSPSTFDPPSRVDNTIIFSQENALPKIEFQSPFWDSISDQAKSCIRYLVALDLLHRFTAHKALCDPWFTPTTTTTDSPYHIYLSPTLTTGVLEQMAQNLDLYQDRQQA